VNRTRIPMRSPKGGKEKLKGGTSKVTRKKGTWPGPLDFAGVKMLLGTKGRTEKRREVEKQYE